MPYVKDLMRRKKRSSIPMIAPDATIFEAMKLMDHIEVSALMVIERGEVVGIVSEKDFLKSPSSFSGNIRSTKIKNVMNRSVQYARLDDEAEDCLYFMGRRGIRHLPIFCDNTLIDFISIDEVIENIIDEKDFLISQLIQYITGNQLNHVSLEKKAEVAKRFPIYLGEIEKKAGNQ